QRIPQPGGILTACFGERRTATASTADVSPEIADELGRVEALPHERLVEVDDEVRAPVADRADDHARGFFLPAHAVGEIAQLSAFQRLRLDENDVPFAVDDVEVERLLFARLARFLAHLLELAAQLVDLETRPVQERVRLARRDRLDPARTRADGALREDHERTDLRRPAHVCAAAELGRVARDLDHAHLLPVLLAEQHHRAELPRFLDRRDERTHGQVLEDLLVDAALDLRALVRAELCRMREVEAQLVGPDGRPGLQNVVAEDVAQRLMEKMRCRVVRHRREAHAPRHDGADAIAFRKTVAVEQEDLIVPEAVRVTKLGARPRIAVELDPARIRDLAAARRVERRLAQLREEQPVLQRLHGAELGQDVRLLVADELGPEARGVRELRGAPVVARDRRARALALLRHQRDELLVVHAERPLARELLRQLEREAVGVVQAERVLARDLAALRRDLLEETHPARERLREALLLRGENAVNLRPVLRELRVALLHLLDDDAREPREVGRLEADAACLQNR